MRRFTVVALVAVVALLAGPMAAAYAGGMGLGDTPLAFQCYLISDPSPGQFIEIVDTISTGPRTVEVGTARLICSPIVGAIVPGGTPRNPSFNPTLLQDHLKCYELRSSKGDNPTEVRTLSNLFSNETVAVGGARFVCVGTNAVP